MCVCGGGEGESEKDVDRGDRLIIKTKTLRIQINNLTIIIFKNIKLIKFNWIEEDCELGITFSLFLLLFLVPYNITQPLYCYIAPTHITRTTYIFLWKRTRNLWLWTLACFIHRIIDFNPAYLPIYSELYVFFCRCFVVCCSSKFLFSILDQSGR